jgi:hypothetical protein
MNANLNLENKIFITTDLAISAYLCTLYKLKEVKKDDLGRSEFIFERTEALENSVSAYFDDTAKVSPNQYFHSLKNLKTRIYQGY